MSVRDRCCMFNECVSVSVMSVSECACEREKDM